MIKLPELLQVWDTPGFAQTFTTTIQQLAIADLPLQQALAHSSHVSDSPRTVVILDSSASDGHIRIKAGIFYAGLIAGSCCADDPSPACEQTEYCEVLFDIDRETAQTTPHLLTP
ncbi:MAG: hypothetical protein R3E93_01970 [Thiothrix sp.]